MNMVCNNGGLVAYKPPLLFWVFAVNYDEYAIDSVDMM